MKRLSFLPALALAAGLLALGSCKKGHQLNVFSLDDDRKLGLQVAQQVESDPKTIVLDTVRYAASYAYLNTIVNNILNSGNVEHKSDFPWRVRIIKDDNTLNAFCAPAGYIYVYTGIIKYLKHEDDFAGVMAHEITHADHRHVTAEMTKEYGLQTLLSVVLGNDSSALTQIGTQLVTLSFSRANEKDADATSVADLCATNYKSNATAAFFRQLIAQGQSGSTPVFLSTHPSPTSRVADIDAKAVELGCDTNRAAPPANWAAFQASLP